MKVCFLAPPAAQRVGGLDAALDSARQALTHVGCPVHDGMPTADEREPTVVHFHGLWQPRFAALAHECSARGWPYVVSPHGMLEPWAWRHKWWKKWPYFWLRERGFLQRAHAVVATAEPEAENLRARVPGAAVKVLPLGLTGLARPAYDEARRRLGWGEQERVLLYLSRLHPKKGLHLLLEALGQIAPSEPRRLVVVGEGDAAYVRELHRLANRLPHAAVQVDWIGPVWGEERWCYFQGADLFCLPTHSENFGLAVLEALQVGTPVLTTYATPWAYLKAPQGYLCHPTVQEVREAVQQFLQTPRSTPAEREQLAAWTADSYGWAALAEKYRAFYEEVLQQVR